jgi:hypothetical protein
MATLNKRLSTLEYDITVVSKQSSSYKMDGVLRSQRSKQLTVSALPNSITSVPQLIHPKIAQ